MGGSLVDDGGDTVVPLLKRLSGLIGRLRSLFVTDRASGYAVLRLAMGLLLMTAGCLSETATPESAATLNPDAPCSFLVLSQLGIDPSLLEPYSNLSLSQIRKVQRIAGSFDKTLRPVSVKEYFDIAETAGAVILEEPNGKLHTILGVVMLDGERYFQLLGQMYMPHLISLSDLKQLSINRMGCKGFIARQYPHESRQCHRRHRQTMA
jgi:hypothetical protein